MGTGNTVIMRSQVPSGMGMGSRLLYLSNTITRFHGVTGMCRYAGTGIPVR
jgi:hypothetical protein